MPTPSPQPEEQNTRRRSPHGLATPRILDAGAPSTRLASASAAVLFAASNEHLPFSLHKSKCRRYTHMLVVVKTIGCILLVIFFTVNVKMHINFKEFSLDLDKCYLGSESPPFLDEAICACEAAKKYHGEYPSMYEKIVHGRNNRWTEGKKDNKYNFLQMINCKLGGYMYATKLGVRTPRVLFCGMAKEIPLNMKSFGNKYVIKPLKGHSARGVKVVRDGIDVLNEKPVSFESLTEKYDDNEEETMVEELMESANPKYDGLTPPDYKFFVYEGVAEIMKYIDRQNGCKVNLDVRSEKWRFVKELLVGEKYPPCPQETSDALELENPLRHKALKDAMQILASNAGPNWIRIDMYDSKHYGPVLGEFTPFSFNGKGGPLETCVMSYLFIAHAEHGAPNDDSDLLHVLTKNVIEFKDMVRMKNSKRIAARLNSTFDFYPPQAHDWLQLDEMTKCKKVMEAQREFVESTI